MPAPRPREHRSVVPPTAAAPTHRFADTLVLRTIVVDDSHLTLKVLTARLRQSPDVSIEGWAASGADALIAVERFRPDLVLLDMSLGDMNGLEVARLLKARPGAPFIAIVTAHDLPEYETAAMEAGADAFVSKWKFAELLPGVIERAKGYVESQGR